MKVSLLSLRDEQEKNLASSTELVNCIILSLYYYEAETRVVYNFGICQIVQIGKSLAFSCSKTIIILAMLAKNRKIPALNLALHNYTNSK